MRAILLLLLLSLGLLAQAPPNPGCPTATANTGGNAPHCVVLTWGAPTTGDAPTSYNLYSGGTATGQCATVTATTCTKVGTANAPSLTFTVNSTATAGLTPGQTYFFVATAVNSGGESGPSTEVSVAIPFLPPSAPTNLTRVAH